MSAGANKGAEGLRWFVETQTMDINIETMDIYVYLLVNNSNKGGCVSKCYLHISVNGMLRDWVAGVPPLDKGVGQNTGPLPLGVWGQRARPKLQAKKEQQKFL